MITGMHMEVKDSAAPYGLPGQQGKLKKMFSMPNHLPWWGIQINRVKYLSKLNHLNFSVLYFDETKAWNCRIIGFTVVNEVIDVEFY